MNDIKCIVIDDDTIQRELINDYIGITDGIESISTFSNSVDAINFLNKEKPDLIFLDIEMPVLNGFELLNSGILQDIKVVLVTAHESFALSSYNYSNIIDFLLKPVAYPRFLQTISKGKQLLNNDRKDTLKNTNCFFIKVNSTIERIELNSILYIEAAVDYVQIYSSNGKYLLNSSLNKIIEQLPEDEFVRVHRSNIVRIDKIEKIEGNILVLNNQIIQIGKSYKEDLMKRIQLL